jgi:Fic family protein
MIAYDDLEIGSDLRDELNAFRDQIEDFRREGPLDSIAVAKLEEHFKASHIYHSAGIEGNRLTLQETIIVLKDGMDISGKPLKDSLEVKNLGQAFDYLKSLCECNQTLRETDVRSLHSILIGHDLGAAPGEYRKVGVIISGSEYHPPEPLEVPGRMESLVKWINVNLEGQDMIQAAICWERDDH